MGGKRASLSRRVSIACLRAVMSLTTPMTRRGTPAASRKICTTVSVDTIVLGGRELCPAAWDASRTASTQAKSRGHVHQLGEAAGLHLAHHAAAVCLHRDLADAELGTHLLVQPAADDQPHDLALAQAQRRITLPQRQPLRFVPQRRAAALDGAADRAH